jgi:cell cycle sensor histidine kinase DivJ
LSVVNAILDMAKLRSGTFDLAPEPFSLVPLVDLCCDIVALKAKAGGVRLSRHCPDPMPEILGDKRIFKQILLNLLSNAVKFTPDGGEVRIAARIEEGTIVFEVADTGIGIDAADVQRLGDPFFQIRRSAVPEPDGTGLGLTVVRGLVGLQGGTISLASAPGQGTCVEVRLPTKASIAAAPRDPAKIEPLARQSKTPQTRGFEEQRMKQSA